MKLKIQDIILPGTNFDGTVWTKTDWIGWFVTTCLVGLIGFGILEYFNILA